MQVRATAPIAASIVAVFPAEIAPGIPGEILDPGETTTTTLEGATTTTAPTEQRVERGLAGTVGIAASSTEWIVPIDTFPGNRTTMWVMNTGVEAVAVEARPLGEVDFYGEEQIFTVAPGTIAPVEVEVGIGIFGYHVDADGPVSIAWEMWGERGAVLVVGIPGQ